MTTKIAWKLTQKLDSEYQLFQNKVKTDYLINTFLCSCGNKHIVLSDNFSDITYQCIDCENEIFYDANLAIQSFRFFLHKNSSFEINIRYTISSTRNEVIVKNYTEIPNSINLISEEVSYKKVDVSSLKLDINGNSEFTYEKEYVDKESYIYKYTNSYYYSSFLDYENIKELEKEKSKLFLDFKKKITEYVIKNTFFDIKRVKGFEELSFSQLELVLKNKNILDRKICYFRGDNFYEYNERLFTFEEALAFVRNFRNEKSIKKAVYQNYLYQMESNKEFNFNIIDYITRVFEDVNLISKMIKLKLEEFNFNLNKIGLFTNLLKDYYTEIQIYNLFKSCVNKDLIHMLHDTIEMSYFTYPNNDNESFTKVKCNIRSIHDEITRCYNLLYNKDLKKKTFEYSESDLNKRCTIKDYEVILPKNGLQLLEIGNSMRNCISSYCEPIYKKRTIIYVFTKERKAEFAVELIDNKIAQASGFANRSLTEIEKKVLDIWKKRLVQLDTSSDIMSSKKTPSL